MNDLEYLCLCMKRKNINKNMQLETKILDSAKLEHFKQKINIQDWSRSEILQKERE